MVVEETEVCRDWINSLKDLGEEPASKFELIASYAEIRGIIAISRREFLNLRSTSVLAIECTTRSGGTVS